MASSLLGFRHPQFSEDGAWLPAWLQPPLTNNDIYEIEGQSPSLQRYEKIGTEENGNALSADDGRYKSCRLFLSGEDYSQMTLSSSSVNGLHFHLHLSLTGNSENGAGLDKSQANELYSDHDPAVQQLATSVRAEENSQCLKAADNAVEDNLFTISQKGNSKIMDPQLMLDSKGMKPEDNIRSIKVADINNAIELSIAASEALIIHQVIKSDLTLQQLSASSALEAALKVKQARLDGLSDTTSHPIEEVTDIDVLSDLDETTMADAYEDIGLSITGNYDHPFSGSVVSHVKDTYASENNTSCEEPICRQPGIPEDYCSKMHTEEQLENDDGIGEALETSAALDFGHDDEKQLHIDDATLGFQTVNLACNVNSSLQWSVEVPDAAVSIESVENVARDMTSFKATACTSQAKNYEIAVPTEKEDEIKIVVPKFQSRWFGGWTWKEENALTPPDHKTSRDIPQLFCGETSFLSESADIAPDENSCVQKQDKRYDAGSQSSIAIEHFCTTDSQGMLLTKDVVTISHTTSSVDPLCSFVPCSISSENALSPVVVQSHKDEVQSNKGQVCSSNGSGSDPTIRRQVAHLRNYSMVCPSLPVHLKTDFTGRGQSSPMKCNLRLHTVRQTLAIDLANMSNNCDETAIAVPESPIHVLKGMAALVPRRKRVRFSEAEINGMQMQETTNKNCSVTRRSKRLKRPYRQPETRAQEVKKCSKRRRNEDRIMLIFQNINFLLTGFSVSKKKEIESLIMKYGGTVLSEIPSPISSRKRSSRFKSQEPVILCLKKLQTTKFLYGCAVNAFILKVDWLADSIAVGSILPPKKYMILPAHVGSICTGIGKPVLSNNYIFDRVGIMIHGNHKFCTKLSEVIKHGGGMVFKTLHWLVQSLDAEKILVSAIVTEDENSVSRHLKKCASEQKIPMMPFRWIIESLYLGRLLPFMEEESHSSISQLKDMIAPDSFELSEEI